MRTSRNCKRCDTKESWIHFSKSINKDILFCSSNPYKSRKVHPLVFFYKQEFEPLQLVTGEKSFIFNYILFHISRTQKNVIPAYRKIFLIAPISVLFRNAYVLKTINTCFYRVTFHSTIYVN